MRTEEPTEPVIRIKRLRPRKDRDIPLPRYMTPGSAGMDICAAIDDSITLAPGAIALVPTGLAMAVPRGFEVQVRPRSGLACAHGIGIPNSPGTIDSDYRGEVMVALINLSGTPYTIRRKDRIAQLVVNRIFRARTRQVKDLDITERNTGGFGHSGM